MVKLWSRILICSEKTPQQMSTSSGVRQKPVLARFPCAVQRSQHTHMYSCRTLSWTDSILYWAVPMLELRLPYGIRLDFLTLDACTIRTAARSALLADTT